MIKTKHIIILIFSTLLAVIAYLYVSIENEATAFDTALKHTKEKLIELYQQEKLGVLNEKQKLNEVEKVLQNMPAEYQGLKHQYQIAMSSLPDIKFYGRVIDQYGDPVEDAKVFFEATNTYLSEGGGRGRIATDRNGRFEIDSIGASLVLGGVGHPEIDGAYYQSSNLDATRDMIFNTSDDAYGRYENWKRYASSNNPYVIHVWRLGKYDGAMKGSLSAYPNLDGREYTLNLSGKDYNTKVSDGVKQGDFIISCTRKTTMTAVKDYGDWTFTISSIDGGIQKTNDLYLNKAPGNGYQSSIKIKMEYGSDKYMPSLFNQRFYFYTQSGKVYGSMLVNFKPHRKFRGNECGIEIQYKMNPTGSKNLELKRENIPDSKTTNIIGNRYALNVR